MTGTILCLCFCPPCPLQTVFIHTCRPVADVAHCRCREEPDKGWALLLFLPFDGNGASCFLAKCQRRGEESGYKVWGECSFETWWGNLCGTATKEEREGLEEEVSTVKKGKRKGSQCHLVHRLQQQSSAFAAQIPVPQPNLETKGGGGQREGGAFPHPTLLHQPLQCSKGSILYSQHCVVLCHLLWGCCCTGISRCCTALLCHD